MCPAHFPPRFLRASTISDTMRLLVPLTSRTAGARVTLLLTREEEESQGHLALMFSTLCDCIALPQVRKAFLLDGQRPPQSQL